LLIFIILILSLTLYNYTAYYEAESILSANIKDAENEAAVQISRALYMYPDDVKIISIEEKSKNCWIVTFDLSNSPFAKYSDYYIGGHNSVDVRYISAEGYYLQFIRWGEFTKPQK